MFLISRSLGFSALRARFARGVTMVEVMLSLAIVSLMLLMLTRWMQWANDDLRAKRNADSLQQFTQMALQYLDINRAGIVGVLSAADKTNVAVIAEAKKYCVLNKDTDHPTFDPRGNSVPYGKATCAIDKAWLEEKKLIPVGFPATNPYGQKWVAIYRLVYADYNGDTTIGATEHQGDIEVLVAATGGDVAPNNELGMTMQLLGGPGGMYPATLSDGTTSSVPTCDNGYICGPGGWKVNVSDFKVTYN
ncbi:MAG: hypothetical protein HYS18_14680 [Burkholderiales bacterium]|nr:hypothetical protein [Burkholderiales bacterium]